MESNPPPAGQEPVPIQDLTQPPRKSRKTLYTLLSIAGVAVLVSIVALTLFASPGLGETIPYGFNYQPGEKLTYNMSATMNMNGQSTTETGTANIEILSFDGGNYNVSENLVYVVNDASQQYSFTLRVNKQGQLTGSSNLPSEFQEMYSVLGTSPGLGLCINRTQVRQRETIQIPLNLAYSGMSMTGNVYYKFGDIQNITVAAGTFNTFKTEIWTDNMAISAGGASMTVKMNGQVYMEYGTCKLIDFHLDETTSGSVGAQNVGITLTMQMTLTHDEKP